MDRVDFTCHGLYYRFSEGRHASLHYNEQKGDVLIEVVSSTTRQQRFRERGKRSLERAGRITRDACAGEAFACLVGRIISCY